MMKKNQNYTIIILCTIMVICIGINPAISYFHKKCQNKYDFSYNIKRKTLGIPVIPTSWHIKERDDESIWWTGDENVIGHKRKSVTFSGCDIYGELDVFTLPLQSGEQRLIEIEYRYGNKQFNDSIKYTYQIGHSAKEISKMTADSIFKVENINRDY